MSPTPPPSFSERLRRFRMDPAALPILVAAVVLVGAVAWLLARPVPQDRAEASPAVAALQQRLAALETAVARQPALEGLTSRLATLESATGPDLAPLAGRIAAVERAAAELAARPVTDPAELAPRPALDALTRRVDGLAQRAEAAIAQEEARATASSARIEGVAQELAARVGTAEQALTQATERLGGVETTLTRRLSEIQEQVAAQRATLEEQAGRITELQGQAQRLSALEGRAGRLATLDQLRAALETGAPLGGALGTLREPPAALTRFAQSAPPTESALRLRFEEAARAAMAASDPGRQGQGVMDSALSRLSGLVTVRRGEEVVFGDAAAAEIEKSRRALEAGDLEGSLAPLQRLSPPAQEAMRPWVEQARALIEARAALRSLAAG
ncbi:COG4223 family protein [Falsiroseomonas sp. E2-1-a20]|uniref:COG4223 family protein n=1 Tax=Falsiroseomonas sp. E2-1-a20 TaxID=3239300 RepID=UPI003F39A9FC